MMIAATLRQALTSTALIIAVSTAAAYAEQPSFDAKQKAAIEDIVRDYILDHPEILPQAMDVLQERMTKKTIAANHDAIYNDPNAIVGGNPRGDVTIVEFFDYSCGYCKMMNPMLNRIVAKDGNIRFIYKEWPVRGPVAEFASRAALAARKQGKYIAFHNALYDARGQLSDDRVLDIAKQQGLDIDKLKADMHDPDIKTILDNNHQLGQKLGLRGTPSFIIGNELIPGAISQEEMLATIKQTRKQAQTAAED